MGNGKQSESRAVVRSERTVLNKPKLKVVVETFAVTMQKCNLQAEVFVAKDQGNGMRAHLPPTEEKAEKEDLKTVLGGPAEEKDKMVNKDIDFRSHRLGVIMDRAKTPGADEKWNKSMKGDAVLYNQEYEATEKQRLTLKVCNPDGYTVALLSKEQSEDSRSDVSAVVVEWTEGKGVTNFMVDGEEYEMEAE